MTDEPRPPVLGDTPRPPTEPRMERWLADQDEIREAHAAGLLVIDTQDGRFEIIRPDEEP
mgnify:CR=1 FL=1